MPSQNNVNDQYAPTQWATGQATEDFTCPSGQKCLVRRPDFGRMIESGLLDNFDFITVEANKHVEKKSANARTRKQPADRKPAKSKMSDAEQVWSDPKQRAGFFKMINVVVAESVVAPELYMPPDKWEDREDDKIYVDTVQLFDRMAIVQWAFGSTKLLANFRSQIEQFADSVDDVTDLENAT